MRLPLPFLAATIAAALSACGQPANFSTATLAGPTNTAAIGAAVQCRTDDALTLAAKSVSSGSPSEALLAHFIQAALYTEAGDSDSAERAVTLAANDPAMNPSHTRQDVQDDADATLRMIKSRRTEETGSPDC